MDKLLELTLDWSEVWALLVPLITLSFKRKQPRFLMPVIIYLWAALFINLIADLIAAFYIYLPPWLQSNNSLYNLHSVIRFICFSYFFLMLRQDSFIILKKALPLLSLILIIINFTYVENLNDPNHLSGNLLAMEAYLLLIYCLQYYLSQLNNEVEAITSGPDFWIVTGLSMYVVINFFVFLFYVPLEAENDQLAVKIWNVHNVAYIILCIFIAKAFYEPARHKLTI